MIYHASIPAMDPERVASVLAELLSGKSFDFHAFRKSRIVVTGDRYGTAIEVYPHTSELIAGETMVSARPSKRGSSHSSTHLAVACPLDKESIFEICAREGWLARECDRGPFRLIEVWIEGNFLIELFPPDLQQTYLDAMTIENWDRWTQ